MGKQKITTEIKKQMEDLRKCGLTYSQIEGKLGVSKWACMTYLKNIKPERSWIEKVWERAEREAENILERQKFSHIVNLNDICPSPYWDYYCEKDNQKWLIDVTVNGKKNPVEKAMRGVEGYRIAILLKNNDELKMIEIHTNEIEIK